MAKIIKKTSVMPSDVLPPQCKANLMEELWLSCGRRGNQKVAEAAGF